MVVRVKRESEWNAVGMFFFCDKLQTSQRQREYDFPSFDGGILACLLFSLFKNFLHFLITNYCSLFCKLI